jgi:hypothetical protein
LAPEPIGAQSLQQCWTQGQIAVLAALTVHYYSGRLFGTMNEEAAGTRQDRLKLGVYYILDWILVRGSREFTAADVLNASHELSSRIALAEEVAISTIGDLLDVLVEGEYLEWSLRNSMKWPSILETSKPKSATESRPGDSRDEQYPRRSRRGTCGCGPLDDGRFLLVDLNSSNCTFLNGIRIFDPAPLTTAIRSRSEMRTSPFISNLSRFL